MTSKELVLVLPKQGRLAAQVTGQVPPANLGDELSRSHGIAHPGTPRSAPRRCVVREGQTIGQKPHCGPCGTPPRSPRSPPAESRTWSLLVTKSQHFLATAKS